MLDTIESSNSHFSRETLMFADISAIFGVKKEGLRLIIVGKMRQATD
jgi:Ni/Fe-hydrogenase subunit HybB-like protein